MSTNSDAHHAPTTQRLRTAQRQGNYARSRDLVWAAIWISGFCGLAWFGESILTQWKSITASAWSGTPNSTTLTESSIQFRDLLLQSLPLILIPFFAAVLFNIMQGGVGIYPDRVRPKLSRLFEREKRFSFESFLKSFATTIKVVSILGVTALVLYMKRNEMFQLGVESLELTFSASQKLLTIFVLQIAGVLALWGAIDYGMARLVRISKLKMTDQELRDERREADGDPRVNSIRSQLPNRQNATINRSELEMTDDGQAND